VNRVRRGGSADRKPSIKKISDQLADVKLKTGGFLSNFTFYRSGSESTCHSLEGRREEEGYFVPSRQIEFY